MGIDVAFSSFPPHAGWWPNVQFYHFSSNKTQKKRKLLGENGQTPYAYLLKLDKKGPLKGQKRSKWAKNG